MKDLLGSQAVTYIARVISSQKRYKMKMLWLHC